MVEDVFELFVKVWVLVVEGWWEVVGGMWVEIDLNLLLGESFVC